MWRFWEFWRKQSAYLLLSLPQGLARLTPIAVDLGSSLTLDQMGHGLNTSKMDQGSELDPASRAELALACDDRSSCQSWERTQEGRLTGIQRPWEWMEAWGLTGHTRDWGRWGSELASWHTCYPVVHNYISSGFEGFGSYWLCDVGSVASLSEPWLHHP